MRWLSGIRKRIRRRRCDTTDEKSRRMPYNPCNPYFRSVIEQVLAKHQTEYKQLQLVVIDTEDEDSMDRIRTLEEEYLVRQMAEGLNHFTICTDRRNTLRKWKKSSDRNTDF